VCVVPQFKSALVWCLKSSDLRSGLVFGRRQVVALLRFVIASSGVRQAVAQVRSFARLATSSGPGAVFCSAGDKQWPRFDPVLSRDSNSGGSKIKRPAATATA
jgi:hypothetical protein